MGLVSSGETLTDTDPANRFAVHAGYSIPRFANRERFQAEIQVAV